MALSSHPLALVASAIGPGELARSMLEVLQVLPFIAHCAFGRPPNHPSHAGEVTLDVLPFVKTPVTPNLSASSVLQIILPFALVHFRGALVNTWAMFQAIAQAARVGRAIWVLHRLVLHAREPAQQAHQHPNLLRRRVGAGTGTKAGGAHAGGAQSIWRRLGMHVCARRPSRRRPGMHLFHLTSLHKLFRAHVSTGAWECTILRLASLAICSATIQGRRDLVAHDKSRVSRPSTVA
mmetsp:Transcript_71187/g.169960  ORF Transcript_71187/g.169960 Transcript_71187/m.169960 type:complete len:236 (+) Transcript_71187:271-978(+)